VVVAQRLDRASRCDRAASNAPRPISSSARMMNSQYRKLVLMPRSAAVLTLSAASQSPIADNASIRFETRTVLSIP
jgi:hypothetical protein